MYSFVANVLLVFVYIVNLINFILFYSHSIFIYTSFTIITLLRTYLVSSSILSIYTVIMFRWNKQVFIEVYLFILSVHWFIYLINWFIAVIDLVILLVNLLKIEVIHSFVISVHDELFCYSVILCSFILITTFILMCWLMFIVCGWFICIMLIYSTVIVNVFILI